MANTEESLKKSPAPASLLEDERLRKDVGDGRDDRAMEARAITGNREISDAARLEIFKSKFFGESLPDLPLIPGYHLCWVSTNNSRDTPMARMRMGYEPVTAADIPGWESITVKSGEYIGFIGVNEMLAFKLPTSLYEMYMNEVHHEAPLRQTEGLIALNNKMSERQFAPNRHNADDGMRDLREKRGPAKFDLT